MCKLPLFQGKSLSLICGALSWLTDFEERKAKEAATLLQENQAALLSSAPQSTHDGNAAEPDWITDFVQKKAERDLVFKLKESPGLSLAYDQADGLLLRLKL